MNSFMFNKRKYFITILIFIGLMATNIVQAINLPELNKEGPDSSVILLSVSKKLIDETNKIRLENKLPILINNIKLDQAAQLKAKDMIENDYFAHTSPKGLTPWYWFKKVEYNYTLAGENLAINFIDQSNIIKAWMKSPLHRANILNKNYTEIGISAIKGLYQGKETIFVVQLFGRTRQTVLTAL